MSLRDETLMQSETSSRVSGRNANLYWVCITVILLTVVGSIGLSLIASWDRLTPDFLAYWAAGERMRQGFLIYLDPRSSVQDPMPFIYPPVFAALFAPLTWFPRESIGQYLWAALHGLFAGVLFWKLLELTQGRTRAWQLAALLMAALSAPLLQEIAEGQVNLLVVLLIACALVDLRRGRDLRAGLWLALAAHLKVIPIVALPLLLLGGRKAAAKGMLVGLLVFGLLPLVWTVGHHGPISGMQDLMVNYIDYIDFVFLRAVTSGNPAGSDHLFTFNNNSGHALLHRWFFDVALWPASDAERGPLLFALPQPLLRVLGYLVPLAMYGLCCFLAFKRKADIGMALVLGFLAAQFLNLLLWGHHLLSLGLLIAVLLARGTDFRRVWLAFAAFAACMTLPLILEFAMIPARVIWPASLVRQIGVWGLPTLAFLGAWVSAMLVVLRWQPPADALAPPGAGADTTAKPDAKPAQAADATAPAAG